MIKGGLAAAASISGLAVAAKLASRYGLIPPDSGGIYGAGETMTYATQRILMSFRSMAREFNRSEISKVAPVTGEPPETEEYDRLLETEFSNWRLSVDGLVERPQATPARGPETHARNLADDATGLRRGLVLHRRMEWPAPFGIAERGRRAPRSEIRGLLPLRRFVGQLGHVRCVAPADIVGIRNEWPGPSHASRRAVAPSRAAATGLQERKVSRANNRHRLAEELRQGAGIKLARSRLLLVRGNLEESCRELAGRWLYFVSPHLAPMPHRIGQLFVSQQLRAAFLAVRIISCIFANTQSPLLLGKNAFSRHS